LLFGFVGKLGGEFADLAPGRVLRHAQPGVLEQVGTVIGDRAFGVERQGVQRALDRQTVTHRREHVIKVVGRRQIPHRLQPPLGAPECGFVHADGQHIELPALGGDVGGQALAQHVFFEHHPVQLDLRMLGLEGFRELLHADHVAVIDGGNGQGLRAKADGAEGHAGAGKQCFCCELHRALHFRAQGATEGRLLLLCLPTRSQEECALITAFKSGGDKSLGARSLILFCTR